MNAEMVRDNALAASGVLTHRIGAELLRDVRDVGGGRLIASVKDADGNLVGLLQDPAGED
jgi:hypothetical protein